MNWPTLVWVFAAALTVHNAEEAVWLPAWSQKKGYWRISATIAEARFVLLSLTIVCYLCAALATAGNSIGSYLICGYALVMLLNVFVPHIIATVALRECAGYGNGDLLEPSIDVSAVEKSSPRQAHLAPDIRLGRPRDRCRQSCSYRSPFSSQPVATQSRRL